MASLPADPAAQRVRIMLQVAKNHGVFFQTLTWDDCSRDVGKGWVSCVGSHIMDATVKNVETGAYYGVFRLGSNRDDRFYNIPAEDFMVVAFDGRVKKKVSLPEYLKNLPTYSRGREGTIIPLDLAGDSVVTVRYQVLLLEDGDHYVGAGRSYKASQSIVVGGNTQATVTHNSGAAFSWTHFGDVQNGDQEHAFVVEATRFKDLEEQKERGEERATAVAAEKATSLKVGPKGDKEGLNVNFVLQVPLVLPPPPTLYPGLGGGVATCAPNANFNSEDGVLESCSFDLPDDVRRPATGGGAGASAAAGAGGTVADVARAARVSVAKVSHGTAPPLRITNDTKVDTTKNLTATVTRVVAVPKGAGEEELRLAATKAVGLLKSLFEGRKTTNLREEAAAASVAAATSPPPSSKDNDKVLTMLGMDMAIDLCPDDG